MSLVFIDIPGPLINQCPPGFLRGLEDKEVVIGKSLALECQFFGIPEVDIVWYKDGGPINDTEQRLVFDIYDDVASLTINDVIPDDEAWYRCNAMNTLGSSFTECQIVVIEKPNFTISLEDTVICEG